MTIRPHYPATGLCWCIFQKTFPTLAGWLSVIVCSKTIFTDIWTSNSANLWHVTCTFHLRYISIYIYKHMMTKNYHHCESPRFPPANLPCHPGYGASLEIRPKLLVLPGSRASHLAVVFFWGGFGKWWCNFWWLIFVVVVALEKKREETAFSC